MSKNAIMIIEDLRAFQLIKLTDKRKIEYVRKMTSFYYLIFQMLEEFNWCSHETSKILNCGIESSVKTFFTYVGPLRIDVIGEENIKIDGNIVLNVKIVIKGSANQAIFVQKFSYDFFHADNFFCPTDSLNQKFSGPTYEIFESLQIIYG